MFEDILKKINRHFSDEFFLLGDMNYSSEETALMEDYFYDYLKKNDYNSNCKEVTKVIISYIVERLKNYDWEENDEEEESTWEIIYSFFDEDIELRNGNSIISLLRTQQFYSCFEIVFSESRRVLFTTPQNRRSFAQTLLFHAYSPRESFKSFIKLAFDEFMSEEGLNREYSKSDLEYCDLFITFITNKYNRIFDGTDINIEFGSAYYGIKRGLMYAFQQNKERSKTILDRIFMYFYSLDDDNNIVSYRIDENSCLYKLTKEVFLYLKRIRNSSSKQRKERIYTDDGLKTIDDLNCNLLFENDKLYLIFPESLRMRKDEEQGYTKAVVKFCTESASINLGTYNFRHGNIVQIINIPKIDVTNTIKNQDDLAFKIIVDIDGIEKKAFENKKKTLLFKNGKIAKYPYYSGEYVIVSKSIDSIIHNKDVTLKEIDIDTYCLEAEEGAIISIDDEKIIFGVSNKNELRFCNDNYIVSDCKVIEEEKELPIFLKPCDICFAYKDNVDVLPSDLSMVVSFNEKQIEFKMNQAIKINGLFIITSDNVKFDVAGYHKIQVVKYSSAGATLIVEPLVFYYDPCFNLSLNNSFVFGSNEVNYSLNFLNYGDIKGKKIGEKDVFIQTGDKKLKVTLPYLQWKFTNQLSFFNKELKEKVFLVDIQAISPSLEILSNLKVDALIIKDKNMVIDEIAGNKNIFSITREIKEIGLNEEIEYDYYALLHDYGEIFLFHLTNKPIIDKRQIYSSFYEENGKLYCNISDFFKCNYFDELVSDYEVKFDMLCLKNNNSVSFRINNPKESVEVPLDFVDSRYEISVEYKRKEQKKYTPIPLDKNIIIIGDLKKSIFYEKKLCNLKITGEKIKLGDLYISNISFYGIGQPDEEEIYEEENDVEYDSIYYYKGNLNDENKTVVVFCVKSEYIKELKNENGDYYRLVLDKGMYRFEPTLESNDLGYKSIKYKKKDV